MFEDVIFHTSHQEFLMFHIVWLDHNFSVYWHSGT